MITTPSTRARVLEFQLGLSRRRSSTSRMRRRSSRGVNGFCSSESARSRPASPAFPRCSPTSRSPAGRAAARPAAFASSTPLLPGIIASVSSRSIVPVVRVRDARAPPPRTRRAAADIRRGAAPTPPGFAPPARPRPSATFPGRAGSLARRRRRQGGRHRRRRRREVQPERRAPADLAVDEHEPADLLQRAVHHRQPEPGAFADLLGGEERLEDVRLRFARMPWPVSATRRTMYSPAGIGAWSARTPRRRLHAPSPASAGRRSASRRAR